ncbi:hypothetical protein Gotur_001850 [Gossypium turneri]
MASTKSSPLTIPLFLTWMILFLQPMVSSGNHAFSIKEATVQDLQLAFEKNQLTSRQLVEFYLGEIHRLNVLLRAVIEVNPDALYQADEADRERKAKAPGSLSGLHGLPILLKDNIATKDKMNTTAGSLALLGSIVPRDAGVVSKLRKAGAIILGKVSLSEWAHFRDGSVPSGWCKRTGQGKNPYNISKDPCGSSSGSAIAAAANLAAVTLGTETDGSILCPSNNNAIVGIKPTVGLTSRAGVVPITPRQDTVGPMCRTVADAVYVLDAIAGLDYNDKATIKASKYIPRGGYKQFLKIDGLKGKRLGLFRNEFFNVGEGSVYAKVFERHFSTLRRRGAVLVENVNASKYLEAYSTSIDYETLAMTAESYEWHWPKGEGSAIKFSKNVERWVEKLMEENKLDALLSPFSVASSILGKGQYPGIIVPAGYDREGLPFGLCFGGLKGSEPTLIEIAYAFEQATKIRRPPSFKH